MQTASYGQALAGQIQVAAPQHRELALTHSGRESQHVQRLEFIAVQGGQQSPAVRATEDVTFSS